MTQMLDIVIPVYNEGRNIVAVLQSLRNYMSTKARVLIVYDHENDTTIPVLANGVSTPSSAINRDLPIELVRNRGSGPHAAVMTGFATSTAPFMLMMPADDFLNATVIDRMVALAQKGNDIVVGSRFMLFGAIIDRPWLNRFLAWAASASLHRFARLPTTDCSNGFRLFSRRVIEQIPVQSTRGFAYGIELTVKAHRRGWNIADVPYVQIERKHGKGRFRVFRWLPEYLRWYFYALQTRFITGHTPCVIRSV